MLKQSTAPYIILQACMWIFRVISEGVRNSIFSPHFFHSAWEIYCACYSNTFQKQNWSFVRKSGWQDIMLSCGRGSLGRTLGRISSQRRWSDIGMGCPGRCWSYCPRGCLRKDWTWHSVPWFCWHGIFSHGWDSLIFLGLVTNKNEGFCRKN